MTFKLEPFTEDDFEQLMAWVASKKEFHQWCGSYFTFPLTIPQLEAYIEEASGEDKKAIIYKVVDIEAERRVGHIALSKIDYHNERARISKVLIGDRAYRGIGLGEWMVERMLQIGFLQLNLHRISLGVFDFNQPARRLYEQAGFHTEGIMRESVKVDSEYWNLIEMGLLRREWEGER
ncbi:GNAT family N-acetyltransferase [Thalassobacillus sp. CUG 92003]|uniref:GNAT family N-acetyltransferase n=1 Tax=Thalassobacillus sp. CUG 92003 TaxID=2736641 RepID=UPI0015E6A867|nr:GNAT family protein [Thalassobacillus sp. CUG 92003]